MTSTPRSPYASPVEQALNQQRLRLRLSWREVARRAQISPETLRKIRAQGTVGVNPVNVASLEQALELPQGAIASIQDGHAPGGPYPPGAEATGGEVELVDAPGGGQAWRLVRVVGGEEAGLAMSGGGAAGATTLNANSDQKIPPFWGTQNRHSGSIVAFVPG